MIADYLSLGPLLMAHISAEVADVEAVLPARDLANLVESAMQSPAVFVVYDGDVLGDNAGRGQAQAIKQRWLVVLAVKNAVQSDGGSALQAEAGPIISTLLTTLQGWQPNSTDFRPLTRVAAPKPGYSPAFAFYPLAFETQLITKGA